MRYPEGIHADILGNTREEIFNEIVKEIWKHPWWYIPLKESLNQWKKNHEGIFDRTPGLFFGVIPIEFLGGISVGILLYNLCNFRPLLSLWMLRTGK